VHYRKPSAYLGVVLAALASCGVKDPQTGKPAGSTQLTPVQLVKRLAEIAAQANQAAPADIDANTRLEEARAGPGLRLTTTYTLVNAESEGINRTTFGPKLTPVVQTASCSNPELRPLIEQGVLVVLEYRGNDGKPLGTISINRQSCQGIPVTG